MPASRAEDLIAGRSRACSQSGLGSRSPGRALAGVGDDRGDRAAADGGEHRVAHLTRRRPAGRAAAPSRGPGTRWRRRRERLAEMRRPAGRSRQVQAAIRSQAGSPRPTRPKSMTPDISPWLTRRLAACRSPCSQTGLPVQGGAARDSCQTARAGAVRAGLAGRRPRRLSRHRGRPAGRCGGRSAGRPAGSSARRAATKRARVTAACPGSATGARAAISPGSQEHTIQGHG